MTLSLLWIQAGSCGGCANAALDADSKPLLGGATALGVDVVWHPSLSEACSDEAVALFKDILAGDREVDALCVEGAILRGPGGSGMFHMASGFDMPMANLVLSLAAKVRHVIAVGSCAGFGGVMAAPGSVAEATGLQLGPSLQGSEGGLLGEGWRAKGGLPVITLAGCPPHPDWIAETLTALSQGALGEDDLDPLGRPRFFSDHLAHHGCNRNEYYEFKASAAHPSQQGCLMENMGCKATQAPGDCNRRRWNGTGSCTNAGFACINCTSPGFAESFAPFQETPKLAGIPVGLPVDMPKAWFVALAALSKSATPERVRKNARADHIIVPPLPREKKPG